MSCIPRGGEFGLGSAIAVNFPSPEYTLFNFGVNVQRVKLLVAVAFCFLIFQTSV